MASSSSDRHSQDVPAIQDKISRKLAELDWTVGSDTSTSTSTRQTNTKKEKKSGSTSTGQSTSAVTSSTSRTQEIFKMPIPVTSNSNKEVIPDYTANFNDIRGWCHALIKTKQSWEGWFDESRPVRLYYPASWQYNAQDDYNAIDSMGRQTPGNQPYACTINPSSGKFERLCVQTRDSFCTLDNCTWDRTIIRNTGPRLLRLANFPLQTILPGKRYEIKEWNHKDWISVIIRWIPESLGIVILVFLPGHDQPSGKDPQAYLPFLYNGYQYPRLARNFWENRREIQERRVDDPSWTLGTTGLYRAFRPRFLCYLTEGKRDENGNRVGPPRFEIRPVRVNDHMPYVFISYTKVQFDSENEKEQDDNYQLLYAMAIRETFIYANSIQDHAQKPNAFWLDSLCHPHSRYIEDEDRVEEVTDEDEKKLLTDQDVYTMSDVIRGADHSIVIARNSTAFPEDDPSIQAEALRGWGQRVWTLNEVILSKGDSVTISTELNQRSRVSKVRLAEIAWPDAGYSRQLVEHFTNLPLSRLELVSVAMRCLDNRELRSKHEGDRSYALMGLLRVRPMIDTSDSSFQAFARLSLPQDNDRLMERLICLLPEHPDEPWNRMSDQYRSILWDIFPDVQVCGIGENDTVFVDGFKGAMIQWSSFSTVQTTTRLGLQRQSLIYITSFSPLLLLLGAILFRTSHAAAIFLIFVSSIILLASPAYVPYLYKGKLYAVEPCLFGIEGYVPLPEIEERIFGANMGRIKWSPYGSPLSRHQYRKRYRERFQDVEAGAGQQLLDRAINDLRDPVYSYPVESVDPCSPCDNCVNSPKACWCKHLSYSLAEEKSKSPYGSMKLFTLIDTFSMTATLFEARHPPVALIIGGSEGGMKRALACSYDITTGTLYRETVLRVPSQVVDKMHSLQRVRLGLKNHFGASNVNRVPHPQPTPPANVSHLSPQTTQPQSEEESSYSLHKDEGIVPESIRDGSARNQVV